MRWIKNIAAGLIGSVALNILHESVRKNVNNAPEINLLGAEAVNKTLSQYGRPIHNPDDLHKVTLELDLIANAAYYSAIGGSGKYIWPKAIAMGLSAGIGALKLPKPLGLDPSPVTETTQKQVLTVGYYLFGALVTALALKTILKS
ncbi:hypothetical protein [Pedobacter xixiisoli]|uniref:Uncharacterized protein n=1 Tax=Pedobacter xixiisoli TaxID=1476464 RepID=A0A285ZUF8_9SPHI|nr:hypothetical protein [Pedobacter xixiisoli]SOD13262.1 hypothetical protein SAMN06297358_1091 [Pedobacter xixiisoli]